MVKCDRGTVQPPEGGYGWIIVFACVLINSSLAPLMQCFGIIYERTFQEMGISAAKISFLLHLQNSIMCSLGLFSGPLLKKFSFKQVALSGCALVCLGISTTTFCTTYIHLIVTLGCLIGFGQGVIMPSTSLAINTYFKKRLTFAMTFSVTGVGLLPIVMPQICNILLNQYGIQGTVLLLAGISFHSIIGALLLRPLQKPVNRHEPTYLRPSVNVSSSEKPLISTVYNETTVAKTKSQRSASKFLALFDLKLLKERPFLIVILGMSISYVSELNIVLMIPFVLAELAHFSIADVALALSIQAGADIFGRLFVPIVMHRFGWSPKVMYSASLIGSSIGRTILAMFFDLKVVVLACTVLLGLSKGSKAVYQSLVLPNCVQFERLPAAMGFLMVTNGILSFAVGPLIGEIHDLTKSYVYALHAATFLSLFCVCLWFVDSLIPTKEDNATALSEGESVIH